MNPGMNRGMTINDLGKLTDEVFDVEAFRKSLLAERTAKVIPFPVEVSPSQVVSMDEDLDQYGTAAEQMAGLTLEQLDHRPEWLRKFSAPDYDTYNSFPALSQLQCECEDCTCTQPPSKFVEARWATFKLCSQCLDGCAKDVEKVVDFDALTDEQLCNDWELRR